MKKAISSIILSLAFSTLINAQNYAAKCGTGIKDEHMWITKQAFGKDDNKLFVFNMGIKESQLEAFDSESLESVYKQNIEVPYLPAKEPGPISASELFLSHRMFYNNHKILCLSAWWDKAEKTNHVLGASYKSKDGSSVIPQTSLIDDKYEKDRGTKDGLAKPRKGPDGKPQLTKVEHDKKKKLKNEDYATVLNHETPNIMEGYPAYSFIQSYDGGKILIIKHYNFEKTVYYKVVDFDLKEIISGEFDIPGDLSIADNFILDNNLNIFYTNMNVTEDAKGLNTFYSVNQYSCKNSALLQFEFSKGEMEFTGITLKLAGEKLYVGGYYAEGKEKAGSFITVLDRNSGKILSTNAQLIENGLPDQGNSLEIKDIILTPSGAGYMISEITKMNDYYSTHTSYSTNTSFGHSSPGVSSSTTTTTSKSSSNRHISYKFGSIYITCFSKENKISWDKKLEKNETLQVDQGWASYGCWLSGDDLNIAYSNIKQAAMPFGMLALTGVTVRGYNLAGDMNEVRIGSEEGDKFMAHNCFAFSDGNNFYASAKNALGATCIKITKN